MAATTINGHTIEPRADLTGADLAGADLTGANLVGAKLAHANLVRVVLTRADPELRCFDLRGAPCAERPDQKAQDEEGRRGHGPRDHVRELDEHVGVTTTKIVKMNKTNTHTHAYLKTLNLIIYRHI